MTIVSWRPSAGGIRVLRYDAAIALPRRAGQFVAATIRLWMRRVAERDELSRFSNHDLQDIGMTPGDRNWEIRKPFWKE